ncbi:MAG: hypothetical protein M1826_004526 [Phylliscum demangeonii]|nr:MAG: hypothetical protein M1826_004526 [Phylliscum demangeonii]
MVRDSSFESCTLKTCPITDAEVFYIPSLGGNIFYAVVFGLLLLTQVFLGIRHRTWGFLVGMVGGLVLELVGYSSRAQMHFNPFLKSPFLAQIVTLTIAPAFISAAIYLCLSRIVVVYGEGLSRVKPRTYSILFITSDFIALLLQAIGGAIASTANVGSTQQMGIHIMLGGLSVQVASLVFFMALSFEFGWRAFRNQDRWDPAHAALRQTRLFRAFLIALALATVVIFIRSVFRVAELSGGFRGKLANDQVTFMILEGAMVVTACLALTFFHPGLCFQGHYNNANFTLRGRPRPKASPGQVTPDEEMASYRA